MAARSFRYVAGQGKRVRTADPTCPSFQYKTPAETTIVSTLNLKRPRCYLELRTSMKESCTSGSPGRAGQRLTLPGCAPPALRLEPPVRPAAPGFAAPARRTRIVPEFPLYAGASTGAVPGALEPVAKDVDNRSGHRRTHSATVTGLPVARDHPVTARALTSRRIATYYRARELVTDPYRLQSTVERGRQWVVCCIPFTCY